jgi:hypothetical protein
MLAKRLPLLWTFAGGCLSGAVLIASWPGETGTIETPKKQSVVDRNTGTLSPPTAPPIAATNATEGRAILDDASSARAEPGSSVADVLTRLEAAYRQGLSAAAPVDAPPPAAERVPALPPEPATIAEAPSREQTAVALAATATPPKSAPEVVAQAAVAPEADPAPVLAAREVAAPNDIHVAGPRDIHVGDVHQNTHVGNVHQGDVNHVEQLAILQYFQLLTLPPQTRFSSPAQRPRGGTRHVAPYSFPLTNPDNPWGFDFPPTVLVK